MRLARAVGIGLVAILAAACSPPPGASSSDLTPSPSVSSQSASLTVFAAASLKAAIAAAQAAYEAGHPGVALTVATDSSAALEARIEQGAPADLFLSADTANPQTLVSADLADGAVALFAGNHLTVIVPPTNPAAVTSPLDLARPGVKVIAAGDAVPITKYANQVVANLASLAGSPADFAARYAANVVSREDNVAAVVAKVALGEGDAGIVYVTDAKASKEVVTVPLPDAANVPATYGGVVVKASAHLAAAHAFLSWLTGADGQAILASFGFLPTS
jgi:molybdate transport system substrate-binding protein